MIHGIQHIGIGVKDFDTMWDFYRRTLHFNVPLSRAHSVADRMGSLTGGDHKRKVVIALNLLGGGLIEILQFTSKEPVSSPHVAWDRYGFLSFALKVIDLDAACAQIEDSGAEVIVAPAPMAPAEEDGWRQLYFRDPEGNMLSLVEAPEIDFAFKRTGSNIGGILFPTVGVSSMERSLAFYRGILDYTRVVYDWQGEDPRLASLPGAGGVPIRRVLLARDREPTSLFRYYLDGGMIELIEVPKAAGSHLYADRDWGDQGIMELCLDVNAIGATYQNLISRGAEPVIEPEDEDFDMGGGSSALFAYVQDPDGTWIELAEIISFNIFLGLKFNLRKRGSQRPLSPTLLRLLRFAATS